MQWLEIGGAPSKSKSQGVAQRRCTVLAMPTNGLAGCLAWHGMGKRLLFSGRRHDIPRSFLHDDKVIHGGRRAGTLPAAGFGGRRSPLRQAPSITGHPWRRMALLNRLPPPIRALDPLRAATGQN